MLRFAVRGNAIRMALDCILTSVIRSNDKFEPILEQAHEIAQIQGACFEIAFRRAARIGNPVTGAGLGHNLHQAARALWRHGFRVVAGFDLDHSMNERRIYCRCSSGGFNVACKRFARKLFGGGPCGLAFISARSRNTSSLKLCPEAVCGVYRQPVLFLRKRWRSILGKVCSRCFGMRR